MATKYSNNPGERCRLPPEGWICVLPPHEGPCPTVPADQPHEYLVGCPVCGGKGLIMPEACNNFECGPTCMFENWCTSCGHQDFEHNPTVKITGVEHEL